MGFEPQARHPIFDCEGHAHRRTGPEFPMSPAGGERIEREGVPKVHHGTDRTTIGFNASPRLAKTCDPITPTVATIATPPNKKYRARKVIVAFIPVCNRCPYHAT